MCIVHVIEKKYVCAIWGTKFYAYLPKSTSVAYFSNLSARSYSKPHCQYQIRFFPYLLYLNSKIVDSWGHVFQYSVAFLSWGPSIKSTILHWALPLSTWDYTISCQGQIVLKDKLPFSTVVQFIGLDIIFLDVPRKLIFVWVLVFFTFFQAHLFASRL